MISNYTGQSVLPGSITALPVPPGLEGLMREQRGNDTVDYSDWDMSDQLDFVPSSQPSQDGEDAFSMTPLHRIPHFGIALPNNSTPASASEGIHGHNFGDYSMEAGVSHRTRNFGDYSMEAGVSHRTRLVRRASPAEPQKTSLIKNVTTPRSLNLVRRVAKPSEKFFKALELERKRERALHEARRVSKKIQVLNSVTARLRREHRRLRALAAASRKDKENIFGA
ncbi:hypothetical protein C8R45DRAFT_1174571 [Mycena sanguinolenta]|nr:hypothetical protein C8R45DRAFT_1174571 [Mycena sanguinolenta]